MPETAVQQTNCESYNMPTSKLTIDQMMKTIARAYLAKGDVKAAKNLITLPYGKLHEEYQWAIVTLTNQGLLSDSERLIANDYAQDQMYGLVKTERD